MEIWECRDRELVKKMHFAKPTDSFQGKEGHKMCMPYKLMLKAFGKNFADFLFVEIPLEIKVQLN